MTEKKATAKGRHISAAEVCPFDRCPREGTDHIHPPDPLGWDWTSPQWKTSSGPWIDDLRSGYIDN